MEKDEFYNKLKGGGVGLAKHYRDNPAGFYKHISLWEHEFLKHLFLDYMILLDEMFEDLNSKKPSNSLNKKLNNITKNFNDEFEKHGYEDYEK